MQVRASIERKAALLAVAISSVLSLLAAPSASAMFQVTIEPVSSTTATFRGLTLVDVTGASDQVSVVTVFIENPDSPNGFTEMMGITSTTGFVDPLPRGCHVPTADVAPEYRGTPLIVCESAFFDLVGLFTGAGDDRVPAVTWTYPELRVKQIFSPDTPVFMNVFLGPGNDSFGEGDGTDAVRGEAGKDQIAGGNASDLLIGGSGRDHLRGDDEPDVMLGGKGRDTCVGRGRDRGRSCERTKFDG